MTDRERKWAFAVSAAFIAAVVVVLSMNRPDWSVRDERRQTGPNPTEPASAQQARSRAEPPAGSSSGGPEVYSAPTDDDTGTPSADSGSAAGGDAEAGADGAAAPETDDLYSSEDPTDTGNDAPSASREPIVEPDAGASPSRVRSVKAARGRAQIFVRAFLHYEVGDLSGSVRRALSRSAHPRLLRRLLAAPPRTPRDGTARPEGRVVSLLYSDDAPGGALLFTAMVAREELSSPILLTLRRRGSSWLVTDLG